MAGQHSVWEDAGREGSLMLALAETLPAGPIPCYSWLGNLLQDS